MRNKLVKRRQNVRKRPNEFLSNKPNWITTSEWAFGEILLIQKYIDDSDVVCFGKGLEMKNWKHIFLLFFALQIKINNKKNNCINRLLKVYPFVDFSLGNILQTIFKIKIVFSGLEKARNENWKLYFEMFNFTFRSDFYYFLDPFWRNNFGKFPKYQFSMYFFLNFL